MPSKRRLGRPYLHESLTDAENDRLREVLRHAMERLDLSYQDAADRIGISRSHILNFLAGRARTRKETGAYIVQVAGLDPADFGLAPPSSKPLNIRPLYDALAAVYDPSRDALDDRTAVRALLDGIHVHDVEALVQLSDGALQRLARMWLDTAAQRRAEAKALTPWTMLVSLWETFAPPLVSLPTVANDDRPRAQCA